MHPTQTFKKLLFLSSAHSKTINKFKFKFEPKTNPFLKSQFGRNESIPNHYNYSHYSVFNPGRQAEAQVVQTLLIVVSRHALFAVSVARDAFPQTHAAHMVFV